MAKVPWKGRICATTLGGVSRFYPYLRGCATPAAQQCSGVTAGGGINRSGPAVAADAGDLAARQRAAKPMIQTPFLTICRDLIAFAVRHPEFSGGHTCWLTARRGGGGSGILGERYVVVLNSPGGGRAPLIARHHSASPRTGARATRESRRHPPYGGAPSRGWSSSDPL